MILRYMENVFFRSTEIITKQINNLTQVSNLEKDTIELIEEELNN
jgi:hypothetical protein